MYPHLEEEIRRQEAEIARQERIRVPLYTTVPKTDEEKRKETDRNPDTEARGDNASSLPFPLNPEVRNTAERAEEGTSPVIDLDTWPRGKDVLSCNRHMLEHQLVCDTWFVVGKEGGRRGEVISQRIGAHAYVLRSRSSAFYALLSQKGRKAEGERQRGRESERERERESERERRRERESEDISLPDTSPKVFWQLLRYLYYEHLQLEEPEAVMELLDLASAYEVLALREACLRFLARNLAAATACAVLEKAHAYRDPALRDAALTFLRQRGSEAVQSSAVARLCRECLNRVLTLDELNLTPRQRQDVADRWARSHHKHPDHHLPTTHTTSTHTPTPTHTTPTSTKTPADPSNPLGDVVYVRKDPSQSRCYFSQSLTPKRRFDKREQERLKRWPKTSPFSAGSQLRQVTRFRGTRICGSGSDGDATTTTVLNSSLPQTEAVAFSVDRPVYLYGFGVYGRGSEDGREASYRVDAALTRKKVDLVLETVAVKGLGEILPVMLHSPVKLKAGKDYTLAVYLHGPPPSRRGILGKARVKDEDEGGEGGGVVVEEEEEGGGGGATFTFSKAPREVKGNRTDVASGQIPRLYYLPC